MYNVHIQNQTFAYFLAIQHQKSDPNNKTLDDVDPEL
jgi:hypothetical protein